MYFETLKHQKKMIITFFDCLEVYVDFIPILQFVMYNFYVVTVSML